ncbi:MAG: hypothetical protein F6K28_53445, partial [Microcoleus sp. SIO2G3]|nr:hypothetical protein [Microcoleus sp. SIO2G3]
AFRLVGILEPELEKEGLRKLYDDVEVPLIEVLTELEFNGVRLDVPFLQTLGGEMEWLALLGGTLCGMQQ